MPKIRRSNGKLTVKSGGSFVLAGGALFFFAGLAAQIESISEFGLTRGAVPYSVNGVNVTNPSLGMSVVWLFFPAIFWIVGTVLMLFGWNSRFEIDDSGIRRYDLFGRLVGEIAWSLATAYGLEPGKAWIQKPSLVLRGRDTKLEISKLHQAWPLVDGEIVRHLPQFKNASGLNASDMERTKPHIPTEGLAFRPTGYMTVAVALIGFAFVFLVFSLRSGLREETRYFNMTPVILATVPLVLVGTALIAHMINAKVVVTEDCIRRFNMFGKLKDRLAWDDVTGFEHESTSSGEGSTVSYYMMRTEEDYIRLNSQFSRWQILKDAIIGMLPDSARVDLD